MICEIALKFKGFGWFRSRLFRKRNYRAMVRPLNREPNTATIREKVKPVNVGHRPVKLFVNKNGVSDSRPRVVRPSMFQVFKIKKIQKREKVRRAFNGGGRGGEFFRGKKNLIEVAGDKNGFILKRFQNI